MSLQDHTSISDSTPPPCFSEEVDPTTTSNPPELRNLNDIRYSPSEPTFVKSEILEEDLSMDEILQVGSSLSVGSRSVSHDSECLIPNECTNLEVL
jgi:hypothetical protein